MKSRVTENKANRVVDIGIQKSKVDSAMAKKSKVPAKVSFTPKADDHAIIRSVQEKHGISITDVLRMALRRLAEAEQLKAS